MTPRCTNKTIGALGLLATTLVVTVTGCIRWKTDVGKLPDTGYRAVDHHKNGFVREVELTQAATIEDLTLPAGTRIQFDSVHSDIAWIRTRERVVVKGITVPSSSRVDFAVPAGRSSHRLTTIELGEDMTYPPNRFRAGSILEFDHQQRLDKVALKGPHSLGGKSYHDADVVWLNEIGEVTRVMTWEEGQRRQQHENACRNRCAPYGNAWDRWRACMNACR